MKQLILGIAISVLLSTFSPHIALATKGEDKEMTGKVLSQTNQQLKILEQLEENWKKADPASAEAADISQKAAGVYSDLESYVKEQLITFERRKDWYASQGKDYQIGLEYMVDKIERLKNDLKKAKEKCPQGSKSCF
ncbi:MAG: hypothetical protein WC836_12735 [Desulfobacula sp.]|jgi:hypothetical protein